MANSTTQFGGFLTNVGIAQQANSAALGLPWNISHMLIGDAGGEPSQTPDPTPKADQTALVRQVYRAQLNSLYQSPADPNVLVAELLVPPEVGGWWIRELALEDAGGNFIAVAKPAPSYKPLLTQGSGRTQTIRMHVVFGNLANVTLKVDPSVVLATRDYVDKAREAVELYTRNQLKAHVEASAPHPSYLRRADVAKDVGVLSWLGASTGTANALVFKLQSNESVLTAYALGQRFHFLATAGNTASVSVRINGLATVAVRKSASTGLVALVAGDIRAGVLYTLTYDGSYFQLSSNVYSATTLAGYGITDAYTKSETLNQQEILGLFSSGLDSQRIDVASSATLNLTALAPTTRHLNITGAATIKNFTVASGKCYFARAAGNFTLTHGSALALPSSVNIEARAGDTFILRATAENAVEVLCYTALPATSADVAAGVNQLRPITPSLLNASWSSLRGVSGYERLPSGLIIQWGRFSNGVTNYIFPLAFPTACAAVTQMQSGSGSATVGRIALVSEPLSTGFQTSSPTASTLPAAWIAIGY